MQLSDRLKQLLNQPQSILQGRALSFARARQGITVRTSEGDKQAIAASDISSNDVTLFKDDRGIYWAISSSSQQAPRTLGERIEQFIQTKSKRKPNTVAVPIIPSTTVAIALTETSIVEGEGINAISFEAQNWYACDATHTLKLHETNVYQRGNPVQTTFTEIDVSSKLSFPGTTSTVNHHILNDNRFIIQILTEDWQNGDQVAWRITTCLVENWTLVLKQQAFVGEGGAISYSGGLAQYSNWLLPNAPPEFDDRFFFVETVPAYVTAESTYAQWFDDRTLLDEQWTINVNESGIPAAMQYTFTPEELLIPRYSFLDQTDLQNNVTRFMELVFRERSWLVNRPSQPIATTTFGPIDETTLINPNGGVILGSDLVVTDNSPSAPFQDVLDGTETGVTRVIKRLAPEQLERLYIISLKSA